MSPTDVCFWYLADIPSASPNVRIGGRADMAMNGPNVCF
jgi:hypothetical protein